LPAERLSKPLACVGASLALLGAVACSAAPVARAERRVQLCARYRCRTLARNRQVTVIRATSRHRASEVLRQRSYAELQPRGRPQPLGDSEEGPILWRVAVGGAYVAYSLSFTRATDPTTTWKVGRLNALSGRREIIDAELGEEGPRYLPSPGITALIVTPSGLIAWILAGPRSDERDYRVFEVAPTSKLPTLLAEGSDIDPRSLAAAGRYVYWTQGQSPMSARVA
jgi:hypothetical protein